MLTSISRCRIVLVPFDGPIRHLLAHQSGTNPEQTTTMTANGDASTAPTSAPKMSKTKLKQTIWPEPLVVQPTTAHTHSIILLHGRGSNAERFGLELLAAPSSASKTLAQHFPSARFIFPTAKKRRSTVLKRVPINQWFDNFSLEDPSERQHLQYDGLKETTEFVAKLVAQEAEVVGLQRVVLGGLSQGCAAALHILLGSEGQVAMAGFVGMSGWLPFRETLDPSVMATVDEDGGHGNIFGSDDDDDEPFEQGGVHAPGPRSVPLLDLQRSAANTVRDIASLPPLSAAQAVTFSAIPVFLGHGRNDEKVSVELGRQARHALEALGCNVCWRDYDEGHWYKVPEEIDDIVEFLQDIVA